LLTHFNLSPSNMERLLETRSLSLRQVRTCRCCKEPQLIQVVHLYGWWVFRVAVCLLQDRSIRGRARFDTHQTSQSVSNTRIRSPSTFNIHHSWSSVSQGAVAIGLEAQKPEHRVVQNRKCRRNYGTPVSRSFQHGKHLEADTYIDRYTGAKKARNQACLLLKKGQDLATTTGVPHATISLNVRFWVNEKRTHRVELIAANSDEIPQRSYDKVRTQLTVLIVC
jgi:hypothetical protein